MVNTRPVSETSAPAVDPEMRDSKIEATSEAAIFFSFVFFCESDAVGQLLYGCAAERTDWQHTWLRSSVEPGTGNLTLQHAMGPNEEKNVERRRKKK